MKTKVIVSIAENQIDDIADFIEADNPEASNRYVANALKAFHDLPDIRKPARASETLPGDIRQLHVPGFGGYTLRLLYRGEYIALVAAFRPGLTEGMRNRDTLPGLAEFGRDYPEG